MFVLPSPPPLTQPYADPWPVAAAVAMATTYRAQVPPTFLSFNFDWNTNATQGDAWTDASIGWSVMGALRALHLKSPALVLKPSRDQSVLGLLAQCELTRAPASSPQPPPRPPTPSSVFPLFWRNPPAPLPDVRPALPYCHHGTSSTTRPPGHSIPSGAPYMIGARTAAGCSVSAM